MDSLNFFSTNSPYLKHPLLTAERSEAEVDFVLGQMGLPVGAKVLDVGCGFGRHAVPLAQRGFDVVAVDPSAAMIEAGRKQAEEAGVLVDFRQLAGEDYVGEVDAGICLFTTLGQYTDKGDNTADLLTQTYKNIKKEGWFVVQVQQKDVAIHNMKNRERFGDDTYFTAISRRYDGESATLNETFRVVSPQSDQQFFLRYRLFSLSELENLLTETGFTIRAKFGNHLGVPLSENSPFMWVFCQK